MTQQEQEQERARCPSCITLQPVNSNGRIRAHRITLPVSARAVRSVGTGSVSRRCPGSGQPPDHPEADEYQPSQVTP